MLLSGLGNLIHLRFREIEIQLRNIVTLEREEEKLYFPFMLKWRQKIKTKSHIEVESLGTELPSFVPWGR